MKKFWKYALIAIGGLAVLGFVIGWIIVVIFSSLFPSSPSTVSVEKNSVMCIQLEGTLSERSSESSIFDMLGSATASIGLDDMLGAICLAKENKNVRCIYIRCGMLTGATPAMLQELRDALADFKKAGKSVVAYADNYTQGTYYVGSVADKLVVNPSGMIELSGLSSTTVYFTQLLEKVGVKMQIFKVGTYKSAVEPYMLDSMSVANREQTTVFSNEIWNEMLDDISKSRKIKKAHLNELVDEGLMFKPSAYYVKSHLADKLAYEDAMPDIISRMVGCDKDKYNEVGIFDVWATAPTVNYDEDNQIAVYYATGEIVQDSPTSFPSDNQIVGSIVSEDLKALAEDDNVKAVVLRVNSPGGSAYAAEQIWHQVKNIKAKKPIIVSMGGYAASGGYYISCAADWIVAEPTTLTGSIGIFGMFPTAGELLEDKLGLHFSTVKTNEYSDFGAFNRPMNEGETAILQGYINQGYELFTKRCADGRKMEQDSIKVIGEGRVWTGLHAKQLGLVDQLGSLDDAIAVAKKRAKLKDYTLVEYPAKTDFWNELIDQVLGSTAVDEELQNSLGEYYDLFRSVKDAGKRDCIQAAMPYLLRFNL
jgi:protease IV